MLFPAFVLCVPLHAQFMAYAERADQGWARCRTEQKQQQMHLKTGNIRNMRTISARKAEKKKTYNGDGWLRNGFGWHGFERAKSRAFGEVCESPIHTDPNVKALCNLAQQIWLAIVSHYVMPKVLVLKVQDVMWCDEIWRFSRHLLGRKRLHHVMDFPADPVKLVLGPWMALLNVDRKAYLLQKSLWFKCLGLKNICKIRDKHLFWGGLYF